MKLKKITAVLVSLGMSSLALAAEPFTIQDIRVEGLQRTEPTTVFSYLPVKVGDTFTDVEGENIIRNLYATGFFDDVRIETLGSQVLLTVVERPVISSLTIEGGKTIGNTDIQKNLAGFGLGQSRLFNQVTLNQAIATLQEAYRTRGKNAVKITPEVTRLERNRVALNLKVDEGPTTTIKTIEFEGNTHFSDGTLRDQMALSEDGLFTWFTKSNRFADDKFRQDLSNITQFYQNEGYYDFRFTNVDVQTNEDQTAQTIKIDVSEGDRYRWGTVTLDGDTKEVPRADLLKLFEMKSGRWYNRSQMVETLEAIQTRMGTEGYAFSQVNVTPTVRPQIHAVDFVLTVIPDRKIYVNQINISGNNKTRDEVVRRELRQMESAPYDLSKINRSRERVELLGYFDNVRFDTKPIQGTPDVVDLDMSVQERSTGSLSVAAGWAQDDGLLLSGGIAQDNLFGSGKSASLQLSRSKVSQVASVSFTDPYFTPDGVSLGYDVYYRGYNPHESNSNPLGYKTTTVGAGARMGVPITEYDRLNFGLGLEHMSIKLFDYPPQRYEDFVKQHGEKNWIVKGTLGWGRNKTDSALWPTRGYMTSINLDSGLPGGDLQFYSLSHDQKWFFPLTTNLTWMIGGEIGYANSYGKTKELPFFENFYGGGLGSVRGFEGGTLGPKFYTRYSDGTHSSDASSYGGNYKAFATTELLFPFPGLKDKRTARLSIFADAGSVWDGDTYKPGNDNPYKKAHHSTFKNEFRYSAGVAMAWLSPLGAMKFSYAYPLNKKRGDEVQRFQFQLGTVF
ncbi:outer membrane protein assembly factor BamA [Stenoxybacter acetivorans]|uniref:outer membrane protein assembly factor BamA n=1 Tax=Stenoxybacter acetivorans TaxID=422441 RepID=UPI000565C077|nr:outer membrane protein assembly factor BamA [Stenoxybacter acetivorans]